MQGGGKLNRITTPHKKKFLVPFFEKRGKIHKHSKNKVRLNIRRTLFFTVYYKYAVNFYRAAAS